jgi:hypothetical protein
MQKLFGFDRDAAGVPAFITWTAVRSSWWAASW